MHFFSNYVLVELCLDAPTPGQLNLIIWTLDEFFILTKLFLLVLRLHIEVPLSFKNITIFFLYNNSNTYPNSYTYIFKDRNKHKEDIQYYLKYQH